MTITHLYSHEVLPGGIQLPNPDPAWIWVARDRYGIIVAYLVAIYGHGLVMPITLEKLDNAPPMWATSLLRHAADECHARGCQVYLLWTSEKEDKLRELCMKHGANRLSLASELISGRTAEFAGN